MKLDPERYGTVTRNGEGYDIVFERRIAKPLEKVWDAIILTEQVVCWFTEVQIEPRLGGAYRLRFSPDEAFVEGEITRFEPPHLLEHTWPGPDGPEAIIRYELERDGDGCRLRFSNLRVPRRYVGSVAGWHLFLDALPGAIEGRRFEWTMEAERVVLAEYKSAMPGLGDEP